MVPQPHPLPSPSSRAAVGCKVLCAELCLLWHHCHRDDADKSPCTRAAVDHSISLWGRKARRVCSLKDWTAVAFHNPLSLLIRFVIFMPSLVFCRRHEVILCYSVPALLPTHSISPACIQQSSGTAGPMVLLQQSIPGTSPRPTVSSAAPSP